MRGETIRSAADVGWIRDLTVRRMMRPDVTTVDVAISIDDFRSAFPLGSKTQVVAVDADGKYAGVVFVAEAHGVKDTPAESVQDILHYRAAILLPDMNVKQAVATFDTAEAESLAVVDSADHGQVIGILTEAHALRRYAEELDRHRRDILGDT